MYLFHGAAGVCTQLQPPSQHPGDKGFESLSVSFSTGIKANRSNNAGGGVFVAEEDTLKRLPRGSAGQSSHLLHHGWQKKFESPRLENSRSQMGESVGGGAEGKDRGCQKSSGPAVSYSKPLCRVAIFFFPSRSPLRGFSILLPLSVYVPISSFHSFFKILFCDVSFGALLSFRRRGPFIL